MRFVLGASRSQRPECLCRMLRPKVVPLPHIAQIAGMCVPRDRISEHAIIASNRDSRQTWPIYRTLAIQPARRRAFRSSMERRSRECSQAARPRWCSRPPLSTRSTSFPSPMAIPARTCPQPCAPALMRSPRPMARLLLSPRRRRTAPSWAPRVTPASSSRRSSAALQPPSAIVPTSTRRRSPPRSSEGNRPRITSSRSPREGTILTGITAVALAAAHAAEHGDVDDVMEAAAEAARGAAERTPDLMPLLKEAGVVDAGAQGLYVMLDGMLRSVARRGDGGSPRSRRNQRGLARRAIATPRRWVAGRLLH